MPCDWGTGALLVSIFSPKNRLIATQSEPGESLKALVYFNDGDLKTLTAAAKNTLINAVKAVRDLPEVTVISKKLTGMEWREL